MGTLDERIVSAADASARDGLSDWRVQRRALHTTFATGTMPDGLRLVERIVAAAEALNHHPDLDLRYPVLHVSITTHTTGTLTEADAALAEQISHIAAELGYAAEPAAVELELVLDAADIAAVRPFWQALLGYDDATGGEEGHELADPADRMPTLSFQPMTAARPGRNRFHLDVHVPHDAAAARVEAALGAGGRLVDDSRAPSWWVLADAEGNEACVCTWQEGSSS